MNDKTLPYNILRLMGAYTKLRHIDKGHKHLFDIFSMMTMLICEVEGIKDHEAIDIIKDGAKFMTHADREERKNNISEEMRRFDVDH